jgi:hypothetical protein
MTDEKTKQKAIEAVADIIGIFLISFNLLHYTQDSQENSFLFVFLKDKRRRISLH